MAREVPKTQAVAQAALDELAAGTTASEGELGMTSDASFDISGVTIDGRRRHARGRGPDLPDGPGPARLHADAVPNGHSTSRSTGAHYTRADFEDETPAILVESPLAFETVSNPIHATGTANTFEANVQVRGRRPRRQGRRQELRHRDVRDGHARHLRLHDEAVHRRGGTRERSSCSSSRRRTARGRKRSASPCSSSPSRRGRLPGARPRLGPHVAPIVTAPRTAR